MAVLVCIPTNSAGVFPFIHTLSSIYCLQIFGSQPFWRQQELQSANQPLCTVLFLVISHNSLITPQYLLSLANEFGWTPGVGDGQGGLACCNSWSHKESDTTERLNWLTTICTHTPIYSFVDFLSLPANYKLLKERTMLFHSPVNTHQPNRAWHRLLKNPCHLMNGWTNEYVI